MQVCDWDLNCPRFSTTERHRTDNNLWQEFLQLRVVLLKINFFYVLVVLFASERGLDIPCSNYLC